MAHRGTSSGIVRLLLGSTAASIAAASCGNGFSSSGAQSTDAGLEGGRHSGGPPSGGTSGAGMVSSGGGTALGGTGGGDANGGTGGSTGVIGGAAGTGGYGTGGVGTGGTTGGTGGLMSGGTGGSMTGGTGGLPTGGTGGSASCAKSGESCGSVPCCADLQCCTGGPAQQGIGGFTTIGVCRSICPVSDRNLKRGFQSIDSEDVLDRLSRLPISTWSYKTEGSDVRHIGPMAQDFMSTFGVGTDDRTILQVDADGVALASIQALLVRVERLEAENRELRRTVDELREGAQRQANSCTAAQHWHHETRSSASDPLPGVVSANPD